MKTITIKDITISLSDDDLVELKKQLEEKTKFPKWEDIGQISGCYVDCDTGETQECSGIDSFEEITNGIRPTKELCEASVALSKLIFLRDIANEGWTPNWNNGENKATIENHFGRVTERYRDFCVRVLVFKDEETRDGFLEAYRDLITQALPLI